MVARQFQQDEYLLYSTLLRPVLRISTYEGPASFSCHGSAFNDEQNIHHLQLRRPGLLRGQCIANKSIGMGGD